MLSKNTTSRHGNEMKKEYVEDVCELRYIYRLVYYIRSQHLLSLVFGIELTYILLTEIRYKNGVKIKYVFIKSQII